MGLKEWIQGKIEKSVGVQKIFVPIVKKLQEKGVSLDTQKKLASGVTKAGLALGAVGGGLAAAEIAGGGAGIATGAKKLAILGGKAGLKAISSPMNLLKTAAGVTTLSALGGLLTTKGGREALTTIPETAFEAGKGIGDTLGGDDENNKGLTWDDLWKAGIGVGGIGAGIYGYDKLMDWLKNRDKDKPSEVTTPQDLGLTPFSTGVGGLEQFPEEVKEAPRTPLEAQVPKINNIVQVANYINR